MKERIALIRKSVGLTQSQFGERIGVKGNTITGYETGLRSPSDAIILSICREFHVDEYWLRTGEGEMFLPRSGVLVEYMADIVTGDDDLIKDIIQTYMELDEKNRQALREFVDALVEQRKKEG